MTVRLLAGMLGVLLPVFVALLSFADLGSLLVSVLALPGLRRRTLHDTRLIAHLDQQKSFMPWAAISWDITALETALT